MTAPYTTERGEKLNTLRNEVEATVALFDTQWSQGPVNHTLYAAAVRGIVRGNPPAPES